MGVWRDGGRWGSTKILAFPGPVVLAIGVVAEYSDVLLTKQPQAELHAVGARDSPSERSLAPAETCDSLLFVRTDSRDQFIVPSRKVGGAMSGRGRCLACVAALLTIALVAIMSFARSFASEGASGSYQPAVPNTTQIYSGGGYVGYSSPGTVAGSRLQGMASVVQAAGDYNLSTSAAYINMTQAQQQAIKNYSEYTSTYFQTREMNRQARAAERGPRPTEADLVRMARSDVPKSLSPGELNPVSGKISWPILLQDDRFANERAVFEEAFAARSRYGALKLDEVKKVNAAADAALSDLKGMINDVSGTDYAQAKRFVQSLAFTSRQPAT